MQCWRASNITWFVLDDSALWCFVNEGCIRCWFALSSHAVLVFGWAHGGRLDKYTIGSTTARPHLYWWNFTSWLSAMFREASTRMLWGIIWGGGQVGSTLWSLGIGAVDDDAPMDILPEIEEEVPKLVSTFRNPHFRWFGRDVMDWITMIHRGRPWALFSGVVLRARRGETTWLFFSLRLSFGMIGSSGWYCYQN